MEGLGDLYSLEAEQCVLGAILVEPTALPDLLLKVDVQDFYHLEHQDIFDILKELHEDKSPIDLKTISIKLKSRKLLEKVGGEEYLAKMAASVPTSSHLPIYSKIIKEFSFKRSLYLKLDNVMRSLDSSGSAQETMESLRQSIEKVTVPDSEEKLKSLSKLEKPYKEEIKSRREKVEKSGSIGVVTGFKLIDESAPLEAGRLHCLAARPGIGKSSLALNIAINAGMFDANVILFSAEMGDMELMDRVMSQMTDEDNNKFKYGSINDGTIQLALNDLEKCKDTVSFYSKGGLTSLEICRVVEKECSVREVNLVIVDYLQKLSDPMERGMTNDLRIGMMTSRFKALSMDLGVSVLSLSQLNRSVGDNEIPGLKHLRDSGQIEQDADVVMMLHRPVETDFDEDTEEGPNTADLVIKKNRGGPSNIGCKLKFKPETTTYRDL